MAKNTNKNSKDYNVAARKKYNKENLKVVSIACNVNNEKEQKIAEKLQSLSNKTDYIRNLILNDIQKNGKGES